MFLGRAASATGNLPTQGSLAQSSLGLVVTARLRSGYPLTSGRPDEDAPYAEVERLPWTSVIDTRFTWDFASLPGCRGCGLRLVVDVKNLFGKENVVALRRDSGLLAPSMGTLLDLADRPVTSTFQIPRGSPLPDRLHAMADGPEPEQGHHRDRGPDGAVRGVGRQRPVACCSASPSEHATPEWRSCFEAGDPGGYGRPAFGPGMGLPRCSVAVGAADGGDSARGPSAPVQPRRRSGLRRGHSAGSDPVRGRGFR